MNRMNTNILPNMRPKRIHCKNRNIRIAESFYKSIEIPIRIWQTLGCVSFFYSRRGLRVSVLSCIASVLKLVFYLSVSTILVIWNLDGSTDEYYGPHIIIVMYISIFTVAVISILGMFKLAKWSKLLRDIVAIDRGLAEFDVSVDYKKSITQSYWMLAGL